MNMSQEMLTFLKEGAHKRHHPPYWILKNFLYYLCHTWLDMSWRGPGVYVRPRGRQKLFLGFDAPWSELKKRWDTALKDLEAKA
jgi:hypothetical protein